MIDSAGHWNSIYRRTAQEQVSWYQDDPATSMRLVMTAASSTTASTVDVGAGQSHLVDRLLEAGWTDLTVLDVSDAALSTVKTRLQEGAREVSYVVADLSKWEPNRTFEMWHDRAAFHFLTSAQARANYVRAASRAVRSGGAVVLGVFAEDGPARCSGLPTVRHDSKELASTFSEHFRLEVAEREVHITPSGATQAFTWVVLRRR